VALAARAPFAALAQLGALGREANADVPHAHVRIAVVTREVGRLVATGLLAPRPLKADRHRFDRGSPASSARSCASVKRT